MTEHEAAMNALTAKLHKRLRMPCLWQDNVIKVASDTGTILLLYNTYSDGKGGRKLGSVTVSPDAGELSHELNNREW